MAVDNEEIKKALKIKNAIQNYLEQTKEVNIRSTDIFPYLVRRGLFEPDRHNGLYFRRFLKKLYQANMLHSLIPQCKYIPGINEEIFGEWYFNSYKSETQKNVPTESLPKSEVSELKLAQKIIWNLIEGKHPENDDVLDPNQDTALILVKDALHCIIQAEELFSEPENKKEQPKLLQEEISKATKKEKNSISKYKSISAISKDLGITGNELFKVFEKHKLIKKEGKSWIVTPEGEKKGGKMKTSQYGKYVAWPVDIINDLDIKSI